MRASASVRHNHLPHTGALALAHRCENRARRRGWRMRLLRSALLVGSLTAMAFIALWVGWPMLRAPINSALALLDEHAFVVAFVAGLFAWNTLRHARRAAERDFARSWLASAPLAHGEVVDALRRQVTATVAPKFLVPIAILMAVGPATRLAIGHLLAFACTAIALGSFAGWRVGARVLPTAPPSIPRLGRARHVDSPAAGFDALRHWPFAQWLADATPRAHAHIVAAVLLGLPMGIPPLIALLLLMLVANGLAAIGLLRALLASIPAAADAVRSTPLPFPRFAMLLCCRVLFWQVVAATLGGALACALGTVPMVALIGAGAWLAWVLIATLAALACRHRPQQLRFDLVVFATALAALAIIAMPLLAIAWTLAAAWLWRKAATA